MNVTIGENLLWFFHYLLRRRYLQGIPGVHVKGYLFESVWCGQHHNILTCLVNPVDRPGTAVFKLVTFSDHCALPRKTHYEIPDRKQGGSLSRFIVGSKLCAIFFASLRKSVHLIIRRYFTNRIPPEYPWDFSMHGIRNKHVYQRQYASSNILSLKGFPLQSVWTI